jgi:hypothetical protein
MTSIKNLDLLLCSRKTDFGGQFNAKYNEHFLPLSDPLSKFTHLIKVYRFSH